MEFTLYPFRIGREIRNGGTGIVVDITRQMQKRLNPIGPLVVDFLGGDKQNDDADSADDEDVKVFASVSGLTVSDKIYVRDMPGSDTAEDTLLGSDSTQSPGRYFQEVNMREFVRFKFDGVAFANGKPTFEGSRGSDKIPWHAKIDLVSVFDTTRNAWVWRRNGINEIKLDGL
jgi:hypothetical protein